MKEILARYGLMEDAKNVSKAMTWLKTSVYLLKIIAKLALAQPKNVHLVIKDLPSLKEHANYLM